MLISFSVDASQSLFRCLWVILFLSGFFFLNISDIQKTVQYKIHIDTLSCRLAKVSATAQLRKSHSPFCPWRSVEVKNDPQWCSDEELAADVEKRRVGLLAMKHLPLVIEGEAPAAHPAEVLASAGWEAIGTADGRDFFRCSICLRTHIVQSFAHRATEAKELPL